MLPPISYLEFSCSRWLFVTTYCYLLGFFTQPQIAVTRREMVPHSENTNYHIATSATLALPTNSITCT